MQTRIGFSLALFVLVGLLAAPASQADPCGMVPPLYTGVGEPIKRVGPQKTYVFFKKGVESFVIRPGFVGKVDNFGMLIPFPSPPALRKMPDNIFSHITAAVDPPAITVYAKPLPPPPPSVSFSAGAAPPAPGGGGLSVNTVRVLKQEAVGMYQVAVLEAGSPKALKGWMTRHGYKYPKGMDKVTAEYIKARWCFVAVKTRVSGKKSIAPRPGMRKTKPSFPKGGSFSGKVQAMGFRFKTKRLVVPMRLSAYNKGRLRNIVYILTDGPKRIRHIPKGLVVRQLSGRRLYKNVTDLLPMRIVNGSLRDIKGHRWPGIQSRRNPVPRNGLARNLFASDLLAVRTGKLALDHENEKKMLLRIGERLNLRHKGMDWLNRLVLKSKIQKTVERGLKDLKRMTLTVIDGDFPREVLARENLTFATYRMPRAKNNKKHYDARNMRRGHHDKRITRYQGPKARFYRNKFLGRSKKHRRKRRKKRVTREDIRKLMRQLTDSKKVSDAVKKLAAIGNKVIPYLFGEAVEGTAFVRRGWSIVALSEIGGSKVSKRLQVIHKDRRQHTLVRLWAAAARLLNIKDIKELTAAFASFQDLRYRQEMKRPTRKAAERIFAKQKRPSLAFMLRMSSSYSSMRAALAPQIMKNKPTRLIRIMLRHKENRLRRHAASYLASMGRRQPDAVAKALIQTLSFNKSATKVPWEGGALFVPSIRWKRASARTLVKNLLAWFLWTDRKMSSLTALPLLTRKPKELTRMRLYQRQIHNNIRSLSLARVAGYRSPGWRRVGIKRWMRIWGRYMGCNSLQDLLDEQNALRDPKFARALRHCRR